MLLNIENLHVSFATRRGTVNAVRGLNLSVARGETIGIVGESGSGKSVSSFAILRILDKSGQITSGKVLFDNRDLRGATEAQMRDVRGREIAMIFQNPRSSLNPIRRIGHQIEDVLRSHARSAGSKLKGDAVKLLKTVRINDPEQRYYAYPFEMSGGQCQRVLIAMALACQPRLLISDEPTTGLDVTTQKTIMELLADLTHERSMASILITHDLGLAAQYCDRLVVMKDGEVVEAGAPKSLFSKPSHTYTKKLIRATPRPGVTVRELIEPVTAEPPRFIDSEPLLQVSKLRKVFGKGSASVTAVDDVSFDIAHGETLGLVGESGSGKSTVSSIISRLSDASDGTVLLNGESLLNIPASKFARDVRRSQIQMVFQDATDSLNPRASAFHCIADPVKRLTAEDVSTRVSELAKQVGLPTNLLDRFPHQLSGGQKARVGIARALAARPKLLILDEPTAALDVSIQATVLNLLVDLRSQLGMSYLFVSHDLQVVRLLCDRIIVLQKGKIVESGITEQVMANPQHVYTRELMHAAPANVVTA